MADTDHIEVRVYIIGDYGVGKRAIAKRFKKLNSTETLQDHFFVQGDPRDAYGLGKKKDEKLLEAYNSYSIMDKYSIRKEIERIDLMTFAKVIEIEGYNLTFNFFPIFEAEKLDGLNQDQIAKEEDEDYEFEQFYHISLKNVKKEIEKYLLKPSKYNDNNVEHLFLFCFDLKDYSTFERIQIYYTQLDKYFRIQQDFKFALIGNKVDAKTHFYESQRKQIKQFINKYDIKYYEISTLMFFNFENFFSQMFRDLFTSIRSDFEKQTFIDRFQLLMNSRPSFAKADRVTFKFPDTPGPGNYPNDVYDYPKDPNHFRKTFSNSRGGRFVTKIFIGKQGPIFPDVGKDRRKTDKKEKKKKDQKSKTEYGGFGDWDSKNKKEIKEALETNVPGYSLGIRQGHYNFKKERKEKFKQQEKELESAFIENNMTLHIKRPPRFKQQKDFSQYEENKKENLRALADRVKEKEDEGERKRKEILKQQEEERNKKIQELKEKQERIDKKLKEKEEMNKTQKKQFNRSVSANKPKVKQYQTPGPNAYDIRGTYDPRKGFSFGLKCTNEKKKNKNDPEPDFPHLQSDFDRIVNNPNHAEVKYTAPRFKEPKIIEPVIPAKLESLEKRDLTKKLSDRAKVLVSFLGDRQKDLERVLENKERLEQQRQEELEDLINRLPRANNDEDGDYYLNNINYNQVEEKAPQFSMKGRYEHGSIFAIQDSSIKPNSNEEGTDIYGKPIQDENYLNSLPRPQFNSVKPALPAFSFSKADRFYSKQPYKSKPTDNEEERMLFKDGKFAPDDQKFFSTVGFIGKESKNTSCMSAQSMGPPYYKIKGFADIIVEQGAKVNEIRTKIRRKEEEAKKNKSQEPPNEIGHKLNLKSDELNEELQNEEQKEEIEQNEEEHHVEEEKNAN